MKKIFLSMIIFSFAISFVLAQGGQGIHEPGTGLENPDLKEAGQGTGQGLEAGEPTLYGMGQMARVESGAYTNPQGKRMNIYRMGNQLRLEVNGAMANSSFNMTQEMIQNRTRIYAQLSNGRNAEVKIMPDTASETALQRLRLKNCNENCTIELKEVGVGNQTRSAYEMRTERQSRVFGLFKARMQVSAQVDAETGELIQSKKPWWAFLATEDEE